MHFFKEPFSGFFNNFLQAWSMIELIVFNKHPTKMTYLNVISSNSDRFYSQEDKYNLIANSGSECAVFDYESPSTFRISARAIFERIIIRLENVKNVSTKFCVN